MHNTCRSLLILLLLAPLAVAGCDGDDDRVQTDILTLTDTFSLNDTDVAFTDFVANIRYTVPAITANVVANGAVLVFLEDLEGTWTALPYTYGIEAPDQPVVDYTVSIGYAFDTDLVDVFVEASSSDDVVWDEILEDPLLGTSRRIRFVVFNTFVSGKNDVDLTDYEALRARYGLPE
jgi:hypothetical protein